ADETAANLRPLAPHTRGHVPGRPESRLLETIRALGTHGGRRVRVGHLRCGARSYTARTPRLHVWAALPPRRAGGPRRVHRARHQAVGRRAVLSFEVCPGAVLPRWQPV